MRRIALSVVAGMLLAVTTIQVPASATTTVWKTITTDTSESFAGGVTATLSFSNGANLNNAYAGSPFNAPELRYQTTAAANSEFTITFSSSNGSWTGVSDLKLFYGWVNNGDEVIVSTNVAPSGLDFTDSSLATLSSFRCSGDCGGTGTLASGGKIANGMVNGSRYNGEIALHFATPITSISVTGMTGRTNAGQNGFGVQLPVEVPTATFYGNGASSGSMDPYYSDGSHTLPNNTFQRNGYTFDGWNSAESGDGTDSFSDGDSYDFESDIDLYAQWDADSHNITYLDPDGGTTQSGGDSTYLTDSSFTLPTAPTRDGYSFGGWQITGDHVATETLDPSATTASPSGYGAITLTATWVVDTAGGGGSGSGGGGSHSSSLAQTGFDASAIVALGSGLIALGSVVRRRRTVR